MKTEKEILEVWIKDIKSDIDLFGKMAKQKQDQLTELKKYHSAFGQK